MLLALLASLAALAADRQPSIVLPGAAPLAERTGETSWGVAGGYLASDTLTGELGPQVTGLWGMTDKIAISGGLAVSILSPSVWPELGARYLIYSSEQLSIAPFAVLVGRYRIKPADLYTLSALGVAFEGGWERVRLDASVPLVGYTTGSNYPRGSTGLPGSYLLLTLEAGVSVALNERHSLRLGVLSVLPTVSWRYDAPAWFLESSVSSLGTISVGQVRAGIGL